MSSIRPDSKADLVRALKAVASDVEERAAKFREYVDSFEDVSEEEFAQHVGSEYSGAGFLFEVERQMQAAIHPHDGGGSGRVVRAAKQVLFEVGQHFARQSAKEA